MKTVSSEAILELNYPDRSANNDYRPIIINPILKFSVVVGQEIRALRMTF